ncbi:MAG: hypothetical protein ACOCXJ_05075, partial [Planctomycetota bacterium]
IASAFTIADRVIMLDQGHIVIDAPPQAVKASENPWVQHFIHGQALESERIDTSRFALPTGFATRFATTATQRPVAGTAPHSAQHRIPPSIRLRRPGSQRRRAISESGEQAAVPLRAADETGPDPDPPVGEESRIGLGSLHGEESGILMPVDWQLAATIDLDDDDETTDGLTRRHDQTTGDASTTDADDTAASGDSATDAHDGEGHTRGRHAADRPNRPPEQRTDP